MPFQSRIGALFVLACGLSLSACQFISGLDDLGADAAASSGASSSGSSGSGGGATVIACEDVVASGLSTPVGRLAITPDGTKLIWTSIPSGLDVDKSIMMIDVETKQTVTILSSKDIGSGQIVGIAANDVWAYWLTDAEKGGMDNTYYWGRGARLATPTPKEPFAQELLPLSALYATNSAIYYTSPQDGRLLVKPSGVGAVTYFDSSPEALGDPPAIVPNGDHVYWLRKFGVGFTEAIVYLRDPPMLNEPPLDLVATKDARRFTIVGSKIYWTEGGSTDGKIRTGDIIIGSILTNTADVVQSIPFPTHISASANYIYWAEGSSDACSTAVQRTSAMGTTNGRTTLSSGGPCVSNFAESTDFVYWGAGTTICRAKR